MFLATGSNLGDRKLNLQNASQHIEQSVGKITGRSHIYETEPWGHHDQPDFYNQVLMVQTKLGPEDVMRILLLIEKEMGRSRSFKNASRIIDIDILFYGNMEFKSDDLIIPHPHIASRKFVLEPLNEIAPNLLHPHYGKTVSQMLAECKDPLKTFRVND